MPKLEGLWWVESDLPPLTVPRDEWHWKLLIRMPETVTADMIVRRTAPDATRTILRHPVRREREPISP